MSSTREIDAFDTIVGIFTSYFTRALIWVGIIIAGAGIGMLGLWVNEAAGHFLDGTHVKFLSHATWKTAFDAFVSLPIYWANLCLSLATHLWGIPILLIGIAVTCAFIATDVRTEMCFFIHLIVSPWMAIVTATDIPLFAMPLWIVWSGGWAFLWYKRWHDGEMRVRKEEEYRAATNYRFSRLALDKPQFPEIRFKDPNPVSEPIRLPSNEELRASLNLPEPPPDIDTDTVRLR